MISYSVAGDQKKNAGNGSNNIVSNGTHTYVHNGDTNIINFGSSDTIVNGNNNYIRGCTGTISGGNMIGSGQSNRIFINLAGTTNLFTSGTS